MKAIAKRISTILGIILILLLVVVGISFINHNIQSSKEENTINANGKMVEVNSHEMHILTQGDGDDTLVFMSGGGTSSPVLDFKSLYSLLIDKYKIAVVEKSGYGFSEDADISRDINTILEETRQVLIKGGLEPPYVLFPHSMSGIEAIYWAQEYPEEIKGIIGLDIAVPKSYQDYSTNHFILNASYFGAKIGITRFFPAIANDSAAIKYGTLTENEKQLYRAIFYRRTLTKSMFREIYEIEINAKEVETNGIPNVPMLFFISSGEGTGWDKEKWIEFQTSYIEKVNRGKSIELNSSHYIHNIETEKIAEESKRFIEEIINVEDSVD